MYFYFPFAEVLDPLVGKLRTNLMLTNVSSNSKNNFLLNEKIFSVAKRDGELRIKIVFSTVLPL